MKTNFKISIPKPCHEDWNKFTPDEKGAFCKVCNKSVYDFTKKSADEISTILVREMNVGKKVCGRFNEDQLTPVPNEISSLEPYSLNFTRIKKFALALFLVFGGYLFNSLRSSAQKMGKVAYTCRLPLKGEVQYTPPPQKDSLANVKDTAGIVPVNKLPQNRKYPEVLGDVAVDPIEQLQIMGGVRSEPVVETIVLGQAEIGEVNISKPVIGDTVVTTDVAGTEELIMGLVALPYPEEKPMLPVAIPPDSLLKDGEVEFAVVESTFVETDEERVIIPNTDAINMVCYPNPSSGFINLKYRVKENVQTGILLYDMKGNVVKTLIASQNMYAADYSSRFDISELPDGVYFCTMASGDKTATQRIVLGR